MAVKRPKPLEQMSVDELRTYIRSLRKTRNDAYNLQRAARLRALYGYLGTLQEAVKAVMLPQVTTPGLKLPEPVAGFQALPGLAYIPSLDLSSWSAQPSGTSTSPTTSPTPTTQEVVHEGETYKVTLTVSAPAPGHKYPDIIGLNCSYHIQRFLADGTERSPLGYYQISAMAIVVENGPAGGSIQHTPDKYSPGKGAFGVAWNVPKVLVATTYKFHGSIKLWLTKVSGQSLETHNSSTASFVVNPP